MSLIATLDLFTTPKQIKNVIGSLVQLHPNNDHNKELKGLYQKLELTNDPNQNMSCSKFIPFLIQTKDSKNLEISLRVCEKNDVFQISLVSYISHFSDLLRESEELHTLILNALKKFNCDFLIYTDDATQDQFLTLINQNGSKGIETNERIDELSPDQFYNFIKNHINT